MKNIILRSGGTDYHSRLITFEIPGSTPGTAIQCSLKRFPIERGKIDTSPNPGVLVVLLEPATLFSRTMVKVNSSDNYVMSLPVRVKGCEQV